MTTRSPVKIDSLRSQTLQLEKAIRRIVRANDIQSRAMVKLYGLTSAQIVVCRGILELGEVTTTALSAYADLSPATVVTILDNLEERGIIERYRSVADRRIVHTRLTVSGRALIVNAPRPLGEVTLARLKALDTSARMALIENAAELAGLLERESLGAGSAGRRAAMLPRPEPVSALRSSRQAAQPPARSRRDGG